MEQKQPIIPFVDLRIQYQRIQSEIDAAVADVLQGGWFILGPQVEAFETEFSRYMGGGFSTAVASGTDALVLALQALGVGPGDEVITVSHTFVSTALAVIRLGARPVFVDILPDTFNMNPQQLESRITRRTRAIIPVHLYGQMADMPAIMMVAEQHGIPVVEDACQAHGAHLEGKKAGLWGDLGCFSFYPTKNLGAYGDGGLVLSRSRALDGKLKLLRNYGQTQKYHHEYYGENSRLDEIQAAVLRVKLRHLDEWNRERRRIAALYSREIQASETVCPESRPGYYHVFHLYVLRSPHRSELQAWLESQGVRTQIHYPVPIHKQGFYQSRFAGEGLPDLSETEAAADSVLSLPIFPELSHEQAAFIARAVNTFRSRGQ